MSDQEMNAAVKNFLASPRFAVAGASSDPSKFGHRGMLLQASILDNPPLTLYSLCLVPPAIIARHTA
jgi:hypothetical protein